MLVFLLLTLLTTLTFAHGGHPHTHEDEYMSWELDEDEDDIDEVDEIDDAPIPLSDYCKNFTGVETINGVPPKQRLDWMAVAMKTRFDALGICPSDAFGAVIVNHTNGVNQLLCKTNITRSTYDRTDHGEMRIIRQCSALFNKTLFPGAGCDKSVWQKLSLYTTGEPCTMCMSAAANIGLGEMIFATSIKYLISVGNDQVDIAACEIERRAIAGGKLKTLVIPFQGELLCRYNPYLAWQNDPNGFCPTSCVRATNGTCIPAPL